MSDRASKAAGAARRGDGDAGMDARGRAMHGAIADAGMDDAARAAKARRNAWFLAGVAVFFYLGYIAWMFIRASAG